MPDSSPPPRRRPLLAFLSRVASKVLDPTLVFSFDRTGFARHRLAFEPGDLDVDLKGRTALVTGANSGLGRSSALALAEKGATVFLLCRHPERGRAAETEIRLASGNERVVFECCDVSELGSVHALAGRLGRRPVDVLIHNAGILPDERRLTRDGLESTWATNVTGPFLLTALLLPNLALAARERGEARVINISWGGMYTQRLDLRDVGWDNRAFDGVVAYAQTKRAEVVLSELWAEKLSAAGDDLARIAVNAMHPGWADTPSVRLALPRFYRITRAILRTPRQGADTIVWLAACDRIRGQTGGFYFDRRRVATHLRRGTGERPGDRRRLWALCLSQAGLESDEIFTALAT